MFFVCFEGNIFAALSYRQTVVRGLNRSNSRLEARRSSSSSLRTAALKASSCFSLAQSQSTRSCPPKKVPSSIFTLGTPTVRECCQIPLDCQSGMSWICLLWTCSLFQVDRGGGRTARRQNRLVAWLLFFRVSTKR